MQRIAAVLALVLLLAAAGCTGIAQQDAKYTNGGTVGAPSEVDRSAGSGEAVATGVAPTSAPTDPRLIRNADLRVEVPSLEPALDRVRGVAADQNGTVAGLELRAESGDRRTATVTVRVPEDRFEATLAALRTVGTVRSESVQAQDVTEEYVDLAAKRGSLARQLEQYHRIMENTTGVDQVLKVQEEVERVQARVSTGPRGGSATSRAGRTSRGSRSGSRSRRLLPAGRSHRSSRSSARACRASSRCSPGS